MHVPLMLATTSLMDAKDKVVTKATNDAVVLVAEEVLEAYRSALDVLEH